MNYQVRGREKQRGREREREGERNREGERVRERNRKERETEREICPNIERLIVEFPMSCYHHVIHVVMDCASVLDGFVWFCVSQHYASLKK